MYAPTREEFSEFCINWMKLDDQEWIDAIWKLASKVGWRKKNGEAPNHWHSLVSAYNGVLIAQRGRKPHLLAKKKNSVPQHEKTIINEIKGKSLSERIGFSVVIQIVKRALVLVLIFSSTKIAPNFCSEV